MSASVIRYDPDDLTQIPWAIWPEEPEESFNWFANYYLLLGPSRSLRKAFMTWLGENEPEKLEHYLARPGMSSSQTWSKMCKKWNWRQRARDYDRDQLLEARSVVEEARRVLFESANEAALALQTALKDPRMKVAAAKEILNRVGLPSVSEVNVNARAFTSDEYNQAAEEVAEWEKQLTTKTLTAKNG